jgi:1-acylglycerone phosphate reductase
MELLDSLGIITMTLDLLSHSSIAAVVSKLSELDLLIYNASAIFSMLMAGLAIFEAKELFDSNVWSNLALTRAFLPLLLKSKGMIVNHTSLAGVSAISFQPAYNASKAAIAMFSDTTARARTFRHHGRRSED